PALAAFRAALAEAVAPAAALAAIAAPGPAQPLTRLRLGIDLLALHDPESGDLSEAAARRQAERLLGALPALFHALAGPNPPAPFPWKEGGASGGLDSPSRTSPALGDEEGAKEDTPFPPREGGRGVRSASLAERLLAPIGRDDAD